MCICKFKPTNSGRKKKRIADDRKGILGNRYTQNLIKQDSKEYHISGCSTLCRKTEVAWNPKLFIKLGTTKFKTWKHLMLDAA